MLFKHLQNKHLSIYQSISIHQSILSIYLSIYPTNLISETTLGSGADTEDAEEDTEDAEEDTEDAGAFGALGRFRCTRTGSEFW